MTFAPKRAPPLCACGRFLAAEYGRDREQALLTLARTLVVVEEFEFTLAQLVLKAYGPNGFCLTARAGSLAS